MLHDWQTLPPDVRSGLILFGILLAGVAAVALLALMDKPRWLDRIWLGMVGGAFVFFVPLWIVMKIQDYGWKTVVIAVVGLFVLGFIKGWLTSRPSGS